MSIKLNDMVKSNVEKEKLDIAKQLSGMFSEGESVYAVFENNLTYICSEFGLREFLSCVQNISDSVSLRLIRSNTYQIK